MKNKILASIATIMLAIIVACNPDVQLCGLNEHPHKSQVAIDFDWSGVNNVPDSMFVIANRVINTTRYSIAVNSKNHEGCFIFNPDPEFVPPTIEDGNNEGEGNGDEGGEDNGEGGEDNGEGGEDNGEGGENEGGNVDGNGNNSSRNNIAQAKLRTFPLHVGTYKFLALALDTTELIYQRVNSFVENINNGGKFSDIFIEYKTYNKNDKGLRCNLRNWDDYNPYSNYIQSDITPVVFDSIPNYEINSTARSTVKFRPRNISQNIDIYVNIAKDISKQGFVIDSITAEVSGIPKSINLANGYIDITSTAKMMFRMELMNSAGKVVADNSRTKSLKAHANINVASIVSSSSETEKMGPGILQMIIHAHALVNSGKPDEEKRLKRIQGKINIFNTLKEANLIEIVNDGKSARRCKAHAVLNIATDLEIDGDRIVDTATDDDGVDRWVQCESIIVDI